MKWSLQSYQLFQSLQQPFHHSNPIFSQIRTLPPIVQKSSIQSLTKQLSEAEHHNRIVFNAGDCAESFEEACDIHWDRKVSMFQKFKDILKNKFNKEPIMIGRLAGQYGKPRTTDFTEIDGEKIPTYKGDNVNDFHNIRDRNHCSNRLLQGYHHSLSTYKYINSKIPSLYISHEGLILPYEQCLTRNIQNKYYCLSAHMLWIGERTRQLNGGHIEFFRGIENPIGVKISTKITKPEFIDLVKTLNPLNKHGKLVIITRAGEDKVSDLLDTLIDIKKTNKLNFLFMSDPMHGNTFEAKASKLKTRDINKIQKELNNVFGKLKEQGLPCGMMFECTPEDVTECFGCERVPTEEGVRKEMYKTKCDPRMNIEQMEKVVNNIPL